MLSRVDHILYFSPDLQTGMDEIESLLGVRPIVAGRHPRFGTHNALLSLGDGVYFEVIAHDPGLPPLDTGVLFDLDQLKQGRLGTWVMRAEDIDDVYARGKPLGIGKLENGFRDNPDGSRVEWVASDPFAFPMEGLLPFLISWGNTPHPSGSFPVAGKLEKLSFGASDPYTVTGAFDILGLDFEVEQDVRHTLRAEISTPAGRVVLS